MKNKNLTEGLEQEPYCVVIRMGEIPYQTRLTYSKKLQGRIIEIEEISIEGNETIINSCQFKGKSTKGNGCPFMKELRTLANDIKVADWEINEAIYVDGYYKNH